MAVWIWWKAPSTVPQVENIVQLTNDGRPKPMRLMASDGSRIYFQESRDGSLQIAQTSVTGGETVPLISGLGLVNPAVLDITPDSSALLIKYGPPYQEDNKIVATLPLPAGQPRRIVKANSAALFPDGRQLVYCADNSMYIAHIDGSKPRKILGFSGSPSSPSVSPDGRRMRFDVDDPSSSNCSLWEAGTDETQLHPQKLQVGCSAFGRWTQDGRFFVFDRLNGKRMDLWVLPDKSGIFSRSAKEPIRITNGPLSYGPPLPSRDGKKIFVVGYQNRSELVRYDSRSHQFLPALDGMSVTDVMYSSNGQWMIYNSYPDHSLWRSRADGTERLQLTYSPLMAFLPHISPDGKHVAFQGCDDLNCVCDDQNCGAYIVSMNGGEAKHLMSSQTVAFNPAWSFDGKSLVMNIPVAENPHGRHASQLGIFDIESNKLSVIPDSQSKVGPYWPTPQMIIAVGLGEQDALYSFDRTTGKWSVLADGPISDWMVSPDSNYIYFVRETPGNPEAMRVRLADRKIEVITSLKGFRRLSDPAVLAGTWVGVAPDGSLLLTRDIGTQEIYALNVNWY